MSGIRVRTAVTHLRRVAVLALCGILLGTSGCAGGEPSVPPASDPIDTGVRLPVEDYLLTGRQSKVLAEARISLALSCLDRFGLERPSMPRPRTSFRPENRSAVVNPDRRYGVLVPAVAARYGYHPEPGTYPDRTSLQEPKLTPTASLVLAGDQDHPEHVARVNGTTVPDDGCLGEAERRLGGRPGVYGDSRVAADLNMASFAVTRNDPHVVAAISAWSTCMREAGHPQTDPLEALDQGAPSIRPVTTAQEIAVATTDISCKRRTHLAAVWSQAERQYQEATIQVKAAEFRQIKADLEAQVLRAETVLAKT